MSWQEELRRLDAELASGKISLRQHRKQREELLAAVSGGFRPAPSPAPAPPPAQQAPPEPAGGTPAWPQAEPLGTSAARLLASDVPTTAPSPADERATESMRYPSLDDTPTVITNPARPGMPLPGLTPAPRPQGHVPPLPTATIRPSRRRPTWLFISLGLFLVLAMIVAATWFLGARGTSQNSQNPANTSVPVTSTAGTPTPAVPLENRMPTLPGTQDVNNSTVSVAKGVELGLYPAQAADTFTRNGVQQVVYRGSSQGDDNYFVLAIQAGDPAKAKAIVDYMYNGALTGGFTAVTSAPSTAPVANGIKGTRAMRGTWYASGDTAVVVWVSQPRGLAASRLSQHLDSTVTALRQVLPAG
ncbi:hypothetical protein ORV05_32250 [Amycolatopsis cynarae]|uniref:Uncharacterized protein n=1 Tax=Amycolatopsis cynarae TaxID=2995223 RepID=A0ABY7AZP4_9PSEU|nr:hypothetical protein [Amycolatopsis sp. HUAS 11-8]WAL65509.1 hypothetical protein ORV05_32250 [Amycolatopsis sp. HUAS 11-8]